MYTIRKTYLLAMRQELIYLKIFCKLRNLVIIELYLEEK